MNTLDKDHGVLSPGDVRVFALEICDIPVLNISQVGVSLETRTPLVIGQNYALLLKAPTNSILVSGRVVRCHLSELAEDLTGGRLPLYHNGIEFSIDRNTTESELLNIIQNNLYGEKRRDAIRVKPIAELIADVGRPCFRKVLALGPEEILVESDELPDMDEDLLVLVQIRDTCFEVNCRIIHGSKRDGLGFYMVRMAYLEMPSAMARFLEEHCLEQ